MMIVVFLFNLGGFKLTDLDKLDVSFQVVFNKRVLVNTSNWFNDIKFNHALNESV